MRRSNGTRWGTKIVLVLLAAACGAGAWYAKGQQEVVAADAEAVATAKSATYIQENLTEALKRRPSSDDPEKLHRFLEGVVPVDAAAMRLWGAEGTLVFSSIAADDTTVPVDLVAGVLADGVPVNDPDATTLRTYARAGGFVGEIDLDADTVRGGVTLPWMVGEFGLFGVAIVLLGAALFAGRREPKPVSRTDWGPKQDEKETKKEPGTSDPELEKLRKKTEKAEGSRRAMEDQLNTLRSQLQSGDMGSQSRINELEGSLKDAHGRVSEAHERNTELTRRVAELEATATTAGPAVQRIAALETEVTAAKARTKDLELQLTEVQARAALAETTASSHTGQIDEAHVKARQAELQVSEAVDRASAAEREVGDLRARLTAAESNGHGVDDQVRTLLDELAAAATITEERDRALREAQTRAESAEQLLAAAEARATYAESLVLQTGTQPPQADPWKQSADPLTEERVRELEIALADARAEAWAAKPADDRPSLGVVETHAVPEDEDAQPQVPQEVDEASAIRAELERMGQIVQHSGEAGDIEGLRGRLTKSAARKKGRTALDEGTKPS
jgi:predicted  nucleic acid-binding Zn-ribbon protein